jgi:AAA domain
LLDAQNNTASIIHGPYHAGKTTLLAEIVYELEACGVKTCWLWGDAIALDINKAGNQDELYAYISARLLNKTLQQQDLERYLESYCKDKKLCFIVDEMQAIVDSNIAANFFDWLAKNKIPYVGVGTFKLRDLNWRQSSEFRNHLDAASPFNRVHMHGLEPLSTLQVSQVLQTHEEAFRVQVPLDIQAQIIAEAGGHAASLNPLLLFHFYNRPTVAQWPIVLQTRFEVYMNGVTNKISKDLADPDLRDLVQDISVHKNKPFYLDLNRLKPPERRLLNAGILLPDTTSTVRFTSHLIYRVCLNAVFPRRHIQLGDDNAVKDPIWLLRRALAYVRPTRIADKLSRNADGPSEDVFHIELYCALRDLLPLDWDCSYGAHEETRKRLDLLISKHGGKWAGYELKVNKGSRADLDEPITQSRGYVKEHGIDIYLVNFISKHKKLEMQPTRMSQALKGAQSVVLIHVLYNDSYDVFTVQCPSIEDVDVAAIGDHR